MKTHYTVFRNKAEHCFALLFIFSLMLSCKAPSEKKEAETGDAMKEGTAIEKGLSLYQNYCAGCHGRQLQGSSASALVNTTFKYGSERDAILKSIRDGIPATQMVNWSNVLSENEIESLADYIVAAQNDPGLILRDKMPSELTTKDYQLKIEELVTEGFERPWAIEFVDERRALISENKGNLRWLIDGKLDPTPISGLPQTYAADAFGGLMDVAVDPEYNKNGWVYLAMSHNGTDSADKNTPGMTRVVRGKIKDHQWQESQTLFQVHDSLMVSGGMRWGSRLLFDKQGFLYFTIGDMQQAIQSGNNPQLPSRAEGKIFRINSDGSIPKDNPFYGKNGTLQAIYCVGTRNVQGMAQHPITEHIYFTDHGPRGGDELNILKGGANYGWPVITYGVNYNGSVITDKTQMEGMGQPITYWTPSIAVCAAEFVTGNRFDKWQNNLLVTALKYEELRRLVVDGNRVVDQEILLKSRGRVRDVKIGPDGALYVLTNSPDALLRILPK